MNTVAIIQARMTSTRLPGKVMAELGGMPMLGFMLARVRRARSLDSVWVATTENATDDPIAQYCAAAGIEVFRGDEADVLGRYARAAEQANADVLVRLTADCPLCDPDLVDQAVAMYASGSIDYCGNIVDRTYPDGLDVEVFSRAALEVAALEATAPFDREHVTPFLNGIGREPGETGVRQGYLKFEADFSHVRWTVDTAADLDRVRALVAGVPAGAGWLHFLAHATRQPELLGVSACPR